MKISTKGRYALKMMVEFGLNPGSPTKINQVARSQGISEKYLEQIVSTLSKARLVKSIRGAQGGYILTRAPKDYSVGEILRVMEGSLAPVHCLDIDGICERSRSCVTQNLFKKIETAINNVVDNVTLLDMMEDELSIRRKKRTVEPIP